MSDTSQTRSETASPRKREEAGKRGQVASSADFSSGLFLLAMLLLVSYSSSALGQKLITMFRYDVAITATQRNWSLDQSVSLGRASCVFLLGAAAVLLVGGFGLAVMTSVLQVGFRVSSASLELKPSRLSPSSGVKKIWSLRGIVRTAMGIGKFVACLVAMTLVCFAHRDTLQFGADSFADTLCHAWELCLQVAIVGSMALVAVGSIDLAFQRWQHEEDLKMTRQEVKDETKENEGDPHVKGRIRKLQAEAAKLRTLNDVPKATVVLTNPTHLAVALQYTRGTMATPKVVAKGKGNMAKRIKRRALAAGVPIIERKPLARALYATTAVGSEIPASLYRAVAEILAHVYGLRKDR